jgi:AraC family transcriptional regulator, transcriptional activator FtrA
MAFRSIVAFRSIARLGRRLLKGTGYALALALPLLLVVGTSIAGLAAQNPFGPAPAHAGDRYPAPPAHDPARKTAVVVAGNQLTEVSDLLAPYEVLAASGEFNVYVVAPERTPSPVNPLPVYLCCAWVDLVPHYSFAEYDAGFGAPDLIVVPAIPRATPGNPDAAVLEWLRTRPDAHTVVLSICAGAKVAADAGLLAGHTATTQQLTMPYVVPTHPEVTWVRGARYVDDGQVISSAGVTAGVDATLYTVQRFFGRAKALETAARIGYPHTRFLDDPTFEVPAYSDAAFLPNLFRLGRAKIGLYLYDGVDEIALSSVTDTYPRAFATDVLTVGARPGVVRTRFGLDLLPRHVLASLPPVGRMLVPGAAAAAAAAPIERWGASNQDVPAERIHAPGRYAYDLAPEDLARHETRPIAANAAHWIEYPTAGLDLGDRDLSPPMLARPAGLVALGALAALALRRRSSRGPRRLVPATA